MYEVFRWTFIYKSELKYVHLGLTLSDSVIRIYKQY